MSASPKKPRPSRAAKLMAVTVSLGVLQRALRVAADRAVGHLGISQASAWALVTIGRQGDGARQGVVADLLGVEGMDETTAFALAEHAVVTRENLADLATDELMEFAIDGMDEDRAAALIMAARAGQTA